MSFTKGNAMKYKILELLKASDNFVSGEEIGKIFNISRSAVWKNILKLKELGYDITSVTKKGYFLNGSSNVLNDYEIRTSLTTKIFGKNFLCLKETDSTNEEAKRQAQNNIPDGFLITSENQTKGKGRLGNSWSHSGNSALAFSIVLKPPLIPADITPLTLITGLSVCEAFRKIGIPAYVKWPNDIIINNKKAVGILTEISCEIEKISYVVIGIGVNINQPSFDGELKEKATSLFIETGEIFKRTKILNAILNEFEGNYYKFIRTSDFTEFIEKYESFCLNIGKTVKAVSKVRNISGIAVGISKKGELIVKNEETSSLSFVSGEFSVRLQDGKYI